MISSQTLAVAIADAIRDPEGRRLLSALAEREPVGLLDQSRAAARDADTLAVALTEDPTGRWDSPVETLPDWLLLPILDGLTAWMDGDARTCVHSPHPLRPEPIVMAAWRPGVISCARCAPFVFKAKRGSELDRTCDRCGYVVTGTDEDLILPARITYGATVYLFGLCGDCAADTIPGEQRRTA